MALREKFDQLMLDIETLAVSGEQNIPEALVKKEGDELHFLSDAFQYMTGITLSSYIQRRRLVAALQACLDQHKSPESAAAIAGFSDKTAFQRACQREFGYPSAAIKEDLLNRCPPLSFDDVCCRTYDRPVTHLQPKGQEGYSGITHSQFALMKQAMEMAAFYSLSDEETELVLHLAQDCAIPVSKAAAFYDEYRLQTEPSADTSLISIYDICLLAYNQQLNFSQAREILCEIEADGYRSINNLPDGFFELWLSDYNQNVCHMEVVTICTILEEMERQNISLLQLNDMIDTAEFSSTDLYDVVANYGQANALFNNQEEEYNQEMLEFLDPELAEFLGSINAEDGDPFTIRRNS